MPFVGHARAKDQLRRLTVASSQSNPASRMSRTISTALRHLKVACLLRVGVVVLRRIHGCPVFVLRVGYSPAKLKQCGLGLPNSATKSPRPQRICQEICRELRYERLASSIVSKRLMSVYNSGPSKPGSRSKKFGLDC